MTLLRLTGTSPQLVSKLSAHTGQSSYRSPIPFSRLSWIGSLPGPVTDLTWDAVTQQLFSSSADNLVIMWDIGGKKGQAYELK